MFDPAIVNLDILKKRAYNLRWATVPPDVIPLTAADPDFPCAPEISEAIARFAKDRYFCYGPPEGLPEFKERLAAYFYLKRNIMAAPYHVLPVDSAAFGIYITCKAFLSPGDEAIIFDPVDFLFRYSIETVGGVAVTLPIQPGAPAGFERLRQMITAKTRMICLCNPLNPTGKVFTKNELQELAAIALEHKLLILSDEIWSDLTFAPNEFTSIASLDENIAQSTITVTGFSKAYGLAGLRIGAVLATNPEHYEKLVKTSLHYSTIHGANVLSQVAATEALDKCGYWLRDFVAHLTQMRDLCNRELNSIKGFNCIPPEGCYVAFVNITGTGRTSAEIKELLLSEAKVAVVPGFKQWFGDGAEGYIRISFATSEAILGEALTRIKKVVSAL